MRVGERSRHMAGTEGKPRTAHFEEWWSILIALVGALGSVLFLWTAPGFEPQSPLAWTIPGWLALAYLFVQIAFLLVSATQIRTLGVLDTIFAILPVVAGLVTVVEWVVGHLPLSLFQLDTLGLLIATSLGEFLLTVWIRFVLNRRTIAIDAG
jgi:uncharacterized membrane protein